MTAYIVALVALSILILAFFLKRKQTTTDAQKQTT